MKKLNILTFLFLITLVTNFLANYLPFNNQSTQVVSEKFLTFFTPDNYIFAIWGVIYLTQIFLFYKFYTEFKKNSSYIDQIFNYYVLVNLANSVWLLFWHYEYIFIAWVLIVVILISLINIFLITAKDSKSFAFNTFSIYLGWLSVATIANTSSLLDYYNISFSVAPQIMSLLMIQIAYVLGALMALKHKSIAYLLVIVWASIGIYTKFISDQIISTYLPFIISLNLLYVLYQYLKNRKG